MYRSTLVCLLSAALICVGQASFAQSDDRIRSGNLVEKKFHLHGFFSQAYGVSDGNQVLAITDDGTFEYHDLALQLRYNFTPRDSAVLQLSREYRGASLVQPFRDDVEVDWAYYERRFETGTSLKLGRVPIPLGIFNQIRDVGTLMPFFHPPVSIYFEEQFSNEHVDGLVLSQEVRMGQRWSLDLDAYTGTWELIETSGATVAEAKASDALGAQLWLNTPVQGLRFGVGTSRYDVSRGLLRVAQSDLWKQSIFSIDADFEKLVVRAELYQREVPLRLSDTVSIPKIESDSYYLQIGYRFSPRWSAFAQSERGDLAFALPFLGSFENSFWKDHAVSVNYRFPLRIQSLATFFNVRMEFHENEGYMVENQSINLFVDPPARTRYALLSLSVSF